MEANTQPIKYCLYARKSSESDERQAMSIDSQVKEMLALAEKEGLSIKEVRQESHSAKTSGSRPVFNQLIVDLRHGMFNGILTWAPDRLSRNAGDLGSLVDLMDLGKLQQIKTYSQSFTNSPNEKFLLMILCSQAKLENDNRGLNVKRGIRAKCEMGWRPNKPPLGYYNRAFNGLHDVILDPDRAPIIRELFERVAVHGQSGRTIKAWLDRIGASNRSGKQITLSQVFLILKNPYYYGKFEYPDGSGQWYQGAHEPLVTKELFDQVQKQLESPRKSKWGAKVFAYKGAIHCANCGAQLVGEEKFKRLVNGSINRHVYYRCSKAINAQCSEGYLSEPEIDKQLEALIAGLDNNELKLSERLHYNLLEYQKVTQNFVKQHYLNVDDEASTFQAYAKYVLKFGTNEEKMALVQGLNVEFVASNRQLQAARAASLPA